MTNATLTKTLDDKLNDAGKEKTLECNCKLDHKKMLDKILLDDVNFKEEENDKFLNFKEEENNKFLNKGKTLHNLSCSMCKKRLVKNAKGHSNEESITIFNRKRTVLCCDNLFTFGPTVCRFYICHD